MKPAKPSPRQSSATHLFGLNAIFSFVQLSEAETLARISSGELPVERAGNMVIAEKAKLREIMASPHWQRNAA